MSGSLSGATVYTVANDRFFPGAVALVNSLRLTGFDGTIVVADAGLIPERRARLEQECVCVDVTGVGLVAPLCKPAAALAHPADLVVMVDSDMIVTASLARPVSVARKGKLFAFPNGPNDPRLVFPEWATTLELERPLRDADVYINTGFIAFSTEAFPGLLRRWLEACSRIPGASVVAEGGAYDRSNPFCDLDQDVLNAILMSEYPPGTTVLGNYFEAPFSTWDHDEIALLDARTLECSLRSYRVQLLHSPLSPKPWEPRAYRKISDNAYFDLFARACFAPDAPVRISPDELPIWLGEGLRSRVLRRTFRAIRGVRKRVFSVS